MFRFQAARDEAKLEKYIGRDKIPWYRKWEAGGVSDLMSVLSHKINCKDISYAGIFHKIPRLGWRKAIVSLKVFGLKMM